MENTYPPVHQIRWMADTIDKLQHLSGQMQDNIQFSHAHGQDDAELSYHYLVDQTIKDLIITIEDGLSSEIEDHPSWGWLKGISDIDPKLMGRIVGSIRFWPPMSAGDDSLHNDVKFAHSRGALLNYCGLGNDVTMKNYAGHGNRNASFSQERINPRLRPLVLDQIDVFLKNPDHPYTQYYQEQKQETLSIGQKDDFLDPQEKNRDAHFIARRHTAGLFMMHLWEVVRRELDMPYDYPRNLNLVPHMGEYLDPWSMVK